MTAPRRSHRSRRYVKEVVHPSPIPPSVTAEKYGEWVAILRRRVVGHDAEPGSPVCPPRRAGIGEKALIYNVPRQAWSGLDVRRKGRDRVYRRSSREARWRAAAAPFESPPGGARRSKPLGSSIQGRLSSCAPPSPAPPALAIGSGGPPRRDRWWTSPPDRSMRPSAFRWRMAPSCSRRSPSRAPGGGPTADWLSLAGTRSSKKLKSRSKLGWPVLRSSHAIIPGG